RGPSAEQIVGLPDVGDIDAMIAFARRLDKLDLDTAVVELSEELNSLERRQGVVGTAADVEYLPADSSKVCELQVDQPTGIVDVEDVAYLLAIPAEYLEGQSKANGQREPRNPALVGIPELPRPGKATKAVDDGRDSVRVVVFLAGEICHQ